MLGVAPVTLGSRLALIGLCAGLLSCSDPLPEPSYGCTRSIHCPTGYRCETGVCVPVNEDVSAADTNSKADAGGDKSDSAQPLCTNDEECMIDAPCVTGKCQSDGCAAVPLPEGNSCTDGAVCPTPGVCAVGICAMTGKLCDDYESCTLDTCKAGIGCNHTPFSDNTACNVDGLACTEDRCKSGICTALLKPGHCLASGACFAKGESDPKAPCNRCNPDTFTEGWTGVTSGPCTDNDACTTATQCNEQSQCVGTPVNCDDDNSCTNDDCDAAVGCVHLSNQGTCTDDDPCTQDGDCKDGNCKSKGPTLCDDGNPCTADSCVEGFGCAFTPKNGGSCLADTDPCTDDVCKGGSCVAVPSVAVCKINGTCVAAGATAAQNPCKICSPQLDSKSWTVLDGAQCSDGDACTSFDTCTQGMCVGEPSTCLDNNACTKDDCDAKSGCTFTAIAAPCDDSNKCTDDDFCVAGKCIGTPVSSKHCDDDNPCTLDLCQPSYGCSNKPHPLPCDDGDKCTKNDLCSAGKCVAGGLVCPCEVDGDCDDSNVCTTDKCVPGTGCVNAELPKGTACDDNDKCTSADACKGKICAGTDIVCNDNTPCTADSCVAEAGCSHVALQGKACHDGNACTSADLCLDGKCTGTPKNCDDANACTEDSCVPSTAKCAHVIAQNGSACPDDNVPCTVDQCLGGQCSHAEVANNFCLISGACLSGGALHPAKQCTGCLPLNNPTGWSTLVGTACKDGDACTVAETCDAKGDCIGKKADCSDGSSCTLDSCNPQAPGGEECIHTPVKGACDDGDKCTAKDTCAAGICKGNAIVCDDNDDCTLNSCTTTGGCAFTPKQDGDACADDNLSCTSDVCLAGKCRHQVKPGACRIGSTCFAAGAVANSSPCLSCVPAKNSTGWTALSGDLCDDGISCTGADVCVNGVCKGDESKGCDDNNPCTKDSCGDKQTCVHSNLTGPCEDGDLCTTKDECKAGKCTAGDVVQCANTAKQESCELTVCLPSKGCANVTKCGPLHACVQGACVTHTGTKAGPVALPVPAVMATQPMRPTLRWQESGAGPTASIPRLWIAAQTNECAPALASYSTLFTALFEPAESKVAFRQLKTTSPTGATSWCALQPILKPHPTTFAALVLGWIEGGDSQSGCELSKVGGQARIGILGLNGPDAALSVAAKCPVGTVVPRPTRPDMLMLGASPTSGKQDPAQLSGLLVRESSGGTISYSGNVVGNWGAAGGAPLPFAKLTDHVEIPIAARPQLTAWAVGSAVLTPTSFKKGTATPIPALTATRADATGALTSKRNVVVTGVAVQCDQPAYHAVEAVYDPDVQRIGALISGTCVTGSANRGFLAFARLHPDQAPTSAPKVAIIHDVPKVVSGNALISAFRIAELPNSGHFLAVWAAPQTSVIKAFRIEPKDDFSFKALDLGALAGNFAAKVSGVQSVSSGGLSELVVSPENQRFSLAWEGVGSLYLLTAALPK